MASERARRLNKQLANCSVEKQTRHLRGFVDESWKIVFHEWPSRLSKHLRLRARVVSWRVWPADSRCTCAGDDRTVCESAEERFPEHNPASKRERIVDDSVPEVEEAKDFSQDRDPQRSAEDAIEIPTISFPEKVVEDARKDVTGCEHSHPARRRVSRYGGSLHPGKDQPDDQEH